MNDPHVVALRYRIEHGPGIDWSRAAPLSYENNDFGVFVESERVRFVLGEHYASEEKARSALEADYIPNWEFVVGLERGPDAFRLRFDGSEIVDRHPPPGPPSLRIDARAGIPRVSANLAPPAPPAYPEPPRIGLKRSPDVDSMFQRYLMYLGGREPLGTMAYFCLTVLEQMAGGRRKAAVHFAISKRVLGRIGELSSNKGGPNARKDIGRNAPYTREEKCFLKSAIAMLIFRAAEVEHGPDPNCRQITMADI